MGGWSATDSQLTMGRPMARQPLGTSSDMSDSSLSQSLSEPQPGSGLTTTETLFIEQAQRRGELFISQPYELYSPENHQTWERLYDRMADRYQFVVVDASRGIPDQQEIVRSFILDRVNLGAYRGRLT